MAITVTGTKSSSGLYLKFGSSKAFVISDGTVTSSVRPSARDWPDPWSQYFRWRRSILHDHGLVPHLAQACRNIARENVGTANREAKRMRIGFVG